MNLSVDDGKLLKADFTFWHLYGVYLPQDELKTPHFNYLIDCAKTGEQSASIAIGDFNTGRNNIDIEPFRHGIKSGTPYTSERQYLELEKYWTEAWRYKHPDGDQYTWYIKRGGKLGGYSGYRLDHCFLSRPLLQRLEHAFYLHETRQLNLTDHSALLVDIC